MGQSRDGDLLVLMGYRNVAMNSIDIIIMGGR